jgi:acetate kinase
VTPPAGDPAHASVLPLPAALRAQGIQRYGFHGLSCESVVQQLAAALPRRLLIAHLGNGASITAVQDGVSIDTSMGLTPSGGLLMSTRSGDLDPGVMVFLARELGYDAAMLEAAVDHHGGLAGVSGLDGDLRTLRAAAPSNADAALAIRMFCYAICKQLAAMWVVLGGVDAIVFTGGIGEHDAVLRAEVCLGLSSLGVGLDAARHRALANPVSAANASCQVHVLPSLEGEQIARHTARIVAMT